MLLITGMVMHLPVFGELVDTASVASAVNNVNTLDRGKVEPYNTEADVQREKNSSRSNSSREEVVHTTRRSRIRPKSLNDRHSWSDDKTHPSLLQSNRFVRVLQTKQEREAFEKKYRHEKLTELERESSRRNAISRHIKCAHRKNLETPQVCHVPGVHASLKYGSPLAYCKNCLDAHQVLVLPVCGHFDYHSSGL